jgi:septum formation protein
MADVFLASQSPRRRELLEQIGVQYTVLNVDVAEVRQRDEPPEAYVRRLATEKSQAGWQQLQRQAAEQGLSLRPVLGADTLVELDGEVFEKPLDQTHGLAMIAALSGRTHKVLSAVALTDARGTEIRLSSTEVTFRTISPAEALRYWQSGEPEGKAGGYAIQGMGAVFVQHLSGSYSGVVGLPLSETCELLASYHVALWREAR